MISSRFDLKRFLESVFRPERGEQACVLTDIPTEAFPDDAQWAARRKMAAHWRDGLSELGHATGFEVLPLVTYPATGAHGAPLPRMGLVGDEAVPVQELLGDVSLALALTTFSATAALGDVVRRRGSARVFRGASLPGVMERMQETALAADHIELDRRCRVLRDLFRQADHARVEFSTGNNCFFDLRFRDAHMDDGRAHRDKLGGSPVINLPSGETFQVPYEGERGGVPSRTSGELPVMQDGELVVFDVLKNRIVGVGGWGPVAERFRLFFKADRARTNIAEFAFGCNERAVVTGNTLEDEKAGFHWAYGRSDHLGGIFGAESFLSPATVTHQDVVYARGCPITVLRADLVTESGRRITVIREGEYVVF